VDSRAQHEGSHSAGILALGLRRRPDRVLGQPERLIEARRIDGRQQLSQRELSPDGVGPAGARRVSVERRTNERQRFLAGPQQERELQA
jgi:hypothetical protein